MARVKNRRKKTMPPKKWTRKNLVETIEIKIQKRLMCSRVCVCVWFFYHFPHILFARFLLYSVRPFSSSSLILLLFFLPFSVWYILIESSSQKSLHINAQEKIHQVLNWKCFSEHPVDVCMRAKKNERRLYVLEEKVVRFISFLSLISQWRSFI